MAHKGNDLVSLSEQVKSQDRSIIRLRPERHSSHDCLVYLMVLVSKQILTNQDSYTGTASLLSSYIKLISINYDNLVFCVVYYSLVPARLVMVQFSFLGETYKQAGFSLERTGKPYKSKALTLTSMLEVLQNVGLIVGLRCVTI